MESMERAPVRTGQMSSLEVFYDLRNVHALLACLRVC